jgi:hypothetical protein
VLAHENATYHDVVFEVVGDVPEVVGDVLKSLIARKTPEHGW